MSSNNDQQQQQQQLEYNKKWKSYILISVTSLTNFVSIGETFDQSHSNYVGSNPKVNYMFGVVSTIHHIASILLSQPNCKQNTNRTDPTLLLLLNTHLMYRFHFL